MQCAWAQFLESPQDADRDDEDDDGADEELLRIIAFSCVILNGPELFKPPHT